jgi:hypothetical protein
MRRPRSHDDAAWNEIVQFLFRPLMMLCFAAIAVRIDWSKGIEFLDTELRDIALGSKSHRGQAIGTASR